MRKNCEPQRPRWISSKLFGENAGVLIDYLALSRPRAHHRHAAGSQGCVEP